jgi:hypothetical protein
MFPNRIRPSPDVAFISPCGAELIFAPLFMQACDGTTLSCLHADFSFTQVAGAFPNS